MAPTRSPPPPSPLFDARRRSSEHRCRNGASEFPSLRKLRFTRRHSTAQVPSSESSHSRSSSALLPPQTSPGTRRQGDTIPVYFFALFLAAFCLVAAAGSTTGSEDPCAELFKTLTNYTSFSKDESVKSFAFARPSEVLPCTSSVRFDADRDLGTLDSVVRVLRSFYSNLHLARASPSQGGVPSQYDVISALQGLRSEEWGSAEEFYAALASAVDGLDDGHTDVDLSCPPFLHRLALPLVGVVEAGQHIVRTAPEILLIPVIVVASFSPPFEFDPTPFAGARVLEIDGKPAWQFMADWADAHAHVYHDPGQKLNYAFAHLKWINGSRARSYGAFGTRSYNPGADFVRVKLIRDGSKKEEVVDIPWLSYTPSRTLKGFASSSTYASTFCSPRTILTKTGTPPPMSKHDLASVLESLDATWHAIHAQQLKRETDESRKTTATSEKTDVQVEAKEREASGRAEQAEGALESFAGGNGVFYLQSMGLAPMRLAKRKEVPKRFRIKGTKVDIRMSAASEISKADDYWKVYKLNDGQTCTVCLSTFLPKLPTKSQKDFAKMLLFYAYETAKAFYTADLNCERIIIDLSANSGGATVFIPWVTELIVGSLALPDPPEDLQHLLQFLADTDLIKKLRDEDVGSYSWKGWADAANVPFNETTKEGFFYPVKRLKYGASGDWGYYSSFFKETNPPLSEMLGLLIHSAWGSKPYLLFSDGLCFSACSAFAISMKERFGVKLVSVGGLPSKPMAFSAAGGGFVSEDVEEDIVRLIPSGLGGSTDVPKKFGVGMTMSIKWTNGFIDENSPAPIEFSFVPADYRIDYTFENIVDPSLQYVKVAKHFS